MTQDDVANDAAITLIEMRARWSPPRAEHLTEERQERMAVAWARLRLIDQYEAEFRRQKRTVSLWSFNRETTDLSYEPRFSDEKKLSKLDRQDIEAMIDMLPERPRQVVKLLMYEGMTQAEVAKQLGVTQPAVSATFERARETLRDMLGDYAEDR